MKSHFISLLIAACLTVANIQAGSGAIVAQSGPQRASLLELYTSEGCSSCPPAEKWMASLLENEGLWKNIVPISFHVDYWDYLGWKDPYSSPVFTKRQHTYAREWNTETVYTPEFILDGSEWRSRRLPPMGKADAPGRLVVEQTTPTDYRITFNPEAGFTEGTANLAILGFDLKSNIRSGENNGRQLTHQFVVLNLIQSALEEGGNEWNAVFSTPARPSGRYAVAVWITHSRSAAPLQAAGGWLSRN
jgi:hypothetical protein